MDSFEAQLAWTEVSTTERLSFDFAYVDLHRRLALTAELEGAGHCIESHPAHRHAVYAAGLSVHWR